MQNKFKKPAVAAILQPPAQGADENELDKAKKQFKSSPVVTSVLSFLFDNKELLNDFISNTVSHGEGLLNLVSTLPCLLEFTSKRTLWRHLVKRHLKKS